MFKFLRKKKPLSIVENGVTFIHHNPSRGNIGDYLCSPRHYFKFTDPISNLCIIGGGVFIDFGYKRLKLTGLKPKNSILWASGISIRPEKTIPNKIKSLDYRLWGIRDIDMLYDTNSFLPCSSCLLPMLDNNVSSNRTLLFINADPKVTSDTHIAEIKELSKKNTWTLLFNNCSESELIENFNTHSNIITNSYHGAYWGLLSGKQVVSIGYSSKFTSLAKIFNIDPDRVKSTKRGSGEHLISILKKLKLKKDSISLKDNKNILADFRQKNLDFAEKMIDEKLISGYKLKH